MPRSEERRVFRSEVEHQEDHRYPAPAAVHPLDVPDDFVRQIGGPGDQELAEVHVCPDRKSVVSSDLKWNTRRIIDTQPQPLFIRLMYQTISSGRLADQVIRNWPKFMYAQIGRASCLPI